MRTPAYPSCSGGGPRWDEAHFGKFAAYYVNRTWYFDVHPPLGKLLLGAVAGASGFNGSYDFPSSATYPSDVPYVPLRAYCAVLSAAAVPLVYSGCRHLGLTRPAAVAAAVMVLGGRLCCPSLWRSRG